MPYYLSNESYPLAHEPTPEDLRFLEFNLGGRRVVVAEDGAEGTSGETTGPGWRRTVATGNDERVGLGNYINRIKKDKDKEQKERKRPHVQDARSHSPLPQPVVRQRSPPRKKARPSDIYTTAAGEDQSLIPSPLQSPTDSGHAPAQPSLGSGQEMAALFSLPAIVNHFDQLPDKVQQHVLMHLFRRSRMPTIQRVSSFAATALKRDFISLLPQEIAVQVLCKVDVNSLASAARVSRSWRKLVDGERSVWRTRLMEDGLWSGHGVEEEEEKELLRRYEVLDREARRRHKSKAGTPSDDEPMQGAHAIGDHPTPYKHIYRRRYTNNQTWLNAKPEHFSFPGHGTHVVTCLQFDEDKIVSASDDHSINIYSTQTGQLRKRLDGHEGGVWALEYKGDTLVTGATDRTVRVWDLETLRQTHLFVGHTSTVRCLQIVEPVLDEATGEYQPPYPMIVTGSRDTSLRVWKLPKKGEPAFEGLSPTAAGLNGGAGDVHAPPEENPFHVHHLEGHTEAVRAVAAHGRICISGSYDKNVRVWDIVKGQCIHVLQGHESKVYSIVYDRFRNRCVSGSMDYAVKIWDLASGECLHTLSGHTALVGLLGASPNYYVSAAADASLRVWDANTAELKHVLSSHAAAITCFQHDETKVVSGSDGTLKLWDIKTGRYVRDLIIGISAVWQVAFHGDRLVVASQRAGSTAFDVFYFGRGVDPVDDPKLERECRPSWERGDPREPQTYQYDVPDTEGDYIDRYRALSVKARSSQIEEVMDEDEHASLEFLEDEMDED